MIDTRTHVLGACRIAIKAYSFEFYVFWKALLFDDHDPSTYPAILKTVKSENDAEAFPREDVRYQVNTQISYVVSASVSNTHYFFFNLYSFGALGLFELADVVLNRSTVELY